MNNLITPGIDVDSLSVLVVDDVPLNILLIKKMLSQYTFEIRTANGGQAALDAIAEREVFDRFSELAEGKLTVFVSHRLSSAVTADQIVVLDGGRVVEIGSHSELMALGGTYCLLFTTQASRYTGESH